MNFVSRGVVLMALFGAASCALAQSTITFQYIVPANGVWPPTTFTPTASWNTVSSINLGIGTLPGLQIPGIEQAYDLANVPLNWRLGLTSVNLVVDGFARVNYTVDNGNPNAGGTITTTLTGTLTVQQPVTSPPGSFASGTTLLTVVSTDSVQNTLPASNENNPSPVAPFYDLPNYSGSDSASGVLQGTGTSNTSYTSGTTFNAFNSSGTVYLPIGFAGSATSSGGSAFATAGVTFGAARVTITYTYLPESEWAWAGLPFIAGGWLVRRRLAARSKN
jgi:hypothetical protein